MYFGVPTMFGENWWKQAPFSSAQSVKSPSDLLIDYMADISALLGDAKAAQLAMQGSPGMDLEYRARAILHQIFSWRWAWQARNANNVFEVDAGQDEVFGTMLHYADPRLMYEIWLCNALLIILLGFLRREQSQEDPPKYG